MKKNAWIVLVLLGITILYFMQLAPNQIIKDVNKHISIGPIIFGMSQAEVCESELVIKDKNFLFYDQYIHLDQQIQYVFSANKNTMNEIITTNIHHQVYGVHVNDTVHQAKKTLLDQDFKTFANETLAFKKGPVTIRLGIDESLQLVESINLYILSE